MGDLNASLDADTTPGTVNSFELLARQAYFDPTKCHRLTTRGIYVLQCGDPTGTGKGGPGYTVRDENLPPTAGRPTPPGPSRWRTPVPAHRHASSSWCTATAQLPPTYTPFGKVDAASLKIVEDVAAKGSDNANGQGDGAPKQPVEIKSVTVG